MILALDPGTLKTGYCLYDGSRVVESGVMFNYDLLAALNSVKYRFHQAEWLAIEMIASYGMPVGREVFETCVWIGRFQQAWRAPEAVRLVYRKDVKMYLCGTTKAKDANIRQAIIDIFPAIGGGAIPQIGIKSNPGPLYGVSTHAWAALGVAITIDDLVKKELKNA